MPSIPMQEVHALAEELSKRQASWNLSPPHSSELSAPQPSRARTAYMVMDFEDGVSLSRAEDGTRLN